MLAGVLRGAPRCETCPDRRCGTFALMQSHPFELTGSGGLPPQAENNSLAGGDVDGDGEIDTIHSYTIGDPSPFGA